MIAYSLLVLYIVKGIIYITAAVTAFQFDGGIRLVDGQHRSEGILELYFFGQWGGVCGRSFSLLAADAACVALGYTRSRTFSFVSRYKYSMCMNMQVDNNVSTVLFSIVNFESV